MDSERLMLLENVAKGISLMNISNHDAAILLRENGFSSEEVSYVIGLL